MRMSEYTPSQATPPPVVQSVSVRTPGGWQIDKSVGLAVIMTVLTQFVVCIWYASSAYS